MLNTRADYWNFNTGNMNNVPALPVDIIGRIQPLRDVGTFNGWQLLIHEDYAFLWESICERLFHYLNLKQNKNIWDDFVHRELPYASLKGPYRSGMSSFYDIVRSYLFWIGSGFNFGYLVKPDYKFNGEIKYIDGVKEEDSVDLTFDWIDASPAGFDNVESYDVFLNNKHPNCLYQKSSTLPTTFVHNVKDVRTLYYDLEHSDRFWTIQDTPIHFDFNYFYYSSNNGVKSRGEGYKIPTEHQIKHYLDRDVQDNKGVLNSTLYRGFEWPLLSDITTSNPHFPYVEHEMCVFKIRFQDCGSETGNLDIYYSYVIDHINNTFAYFYVDVDANVKQATAVCHYRVRHGWSSRPDGGEDNVTYQRVDVYMPLYKAKNEVEIIDNGTNNKRNRCYLMSATKDQRSFNAGQAYDDLGFASINWIQVLKQKGYKLGCDQNIEIPESTQFSSTFRLDQNPQRWSSRETIEVQLMKIDVIYRQDCRTRVDNLGWNWDPVRGF